jgi:hypothetical protein
MQQDESWYFGFMVLCILALVVRFILNDVVPIYWLGDYSSMIDFLWILLLAAAFDGCQKVISVHANAQGVPWLAASSEIVRLVTVVTGITFWPIVQARDVASIVCVGAMLSLMISIFGFRRIKTTTAV